MPASHHALIIPIHAKAPMSEESQPDTGQQDPRPVEFIPFNEFRNGLPYGRFRVIVNPKLAQQYMKKRLFVAGISLGLVALGLLLVFAEVRWVGALLVVLGVALSRIVRSQAPKMFLHLAMRDQAVYREGLDQEILEVRRV
jgi:hypothetical protein